MKKHYVLAVAATFAAHVGTAPGGEIDHGLVDVMAITEPAEHISSLVYLWDQGDVAALKQALTEERADHAQRNLEVVRHLQETAALTQPQLIAELERLAENGSVSRYKAFWIANVIRVDAPAAVLRELAEHPSVMSIYYNMPIESIAPVDPVDVVRGAEGDNPQGAGPLAGAGPEPGLIAIQAPEVWDIGFTGSGVLVATLDTGVDGNHPAVGSRWRGHDPAYQGNPGWAWFDPVTSTTSPQEFSFTSHGTHTMGTVLGGAPGDQIGVAPGAEWIHAAVIDRDGIDNTIADAIEAFQWLAAPTGNAGDGWAVPRVASNSWGTTAAHGHPACDETFWSWIDNGEAAGTAHFFAAGNEGSSGLRRPADRALDEYRSSAVGAVNANNPEWPIASFSALGPTLCTETGQAATKPDIVAPGEDVRSSVSGGGYGVKDGTSMAVPHANGVAALMLEACDALTPEDIKQILYDTAHDVGADGKDNTFGWGMIDAYAAVNAALVQCSIGLKLPDGVPNMLNPGVSVSFPVEIVEIKENVVPGSAVLMYRYEGEGFQSSPLSFVGGTLYEATLPPPSCGNVAEFYVQVEGDAGTVRKLPSQAPQSVFTALVGEFVTDVMHQYEFTGGLPSGWTASGLWHLSSSCPVAGQCASGVQYAYYGQSTTCTYNSGVNQGALESAPITFPAAGPGESIALKFCYNLETESSSSYDIARFAVNGTGFEQVLGQSPQWVEYSVDATPWAGQTHTLRWHFDTVDGILNNYRGWQVDQVRIELTALQCDDPAVVGDLTGDGSVGVEDLLQLLAAWGDCATPPNCPADLDGDNAVGVADLLILLANWG